MPIQPLFPTRIFWQVVTEIFVLKIDNQAWTQNDGHLNLKHYFRRKALQTFKFKINCFDLFDLGTGKALKINCCWEQSVMWVVLLPHVFASSTVVIHSSRNQHRETKDDLKLIVIILIILLKAFNICYCAWLGEHISRKIICNTKSYIGVLSWKLRMIKINGKRAIEKGIRIFTLKKWLDPNWTPLGRMNHQM